MYKILAVDDDQTCLYILKKFLEKWNYQVTAVTHAHEALSILRNYSYDLVLTEVHMPDMGGLELLERINREYNLPVILISADTSGEMICKGIKKGAQCFLAKPLAVDDLEDIWQFSEWWKRAKKYNKSTVTMVDSHNGSATRNTPHYNTTTRRRNVKLDWTSQLHNRFVEAMIMIGYHEAAPANILKVMNVPGLTKGQVASHLQRYETFLQEVLDGNTNIKPPYWIDLTYYSSSVSGNPNLALLNQLRDEKNQIRKGKSVAHNPLQPSEKENNNIRFQAPNGSSSVFRSLTSFTQAEGSSSNTNQNMGSTNGSTSNFINNLSNRNNEMGCLNEHTLGQEHNNCSRIGGLNEVANSNIFPYANNVAPSNINVGGQDNNVAPSSDANHFGNISDINPQQLGGEQMTDGGWFNNSGSEDYINQWFDKGIDEDIWD